MSIISGAVRLNLFRVVVGYAGIYHIILGLIGTFAGPTVVVALSSAVYGISPTPDDQFLVAGRFAAAYMIPFGMVLGLLAMNPHKYSILVWPAVALFLVRIFDRLVYAGQIEQAFGTTMERSLITVAIAGIILLTLILLRPDSTASAGAKE